MEDSWAKRMKYQSYDRCFDCCSCLLETSQKKVAPIWWKTAGLNEWNIRVTIVVSIVVVAFLYFFSFFAQAHCRFLPEYLHIISCHCETGRQLCKFRVVAMACDPWCSPFAARFHAVAIWRHLPRFVLLITVVVFSIIKSLFRRAVTLDRYIQYRSARTRSSVNTYGAQVHIDRIVCPNMSIFLSATTHCRSSHLTCFLSLLFSFSVLLVESSFLLR